MLVTPTIRQIPASRPDALAFRIAGEVPKADLHAMAAYMTGRFAALGKVDMLLILDGFEGTGRGAALDPAYLKAEFEALRDVRRYAVVGAPRAAGLLIEAMAHLTPVEARVFPAGAEAEAWAFIAAAPAG